MKRKRRTDRSMEVLVYGRTDRMEVLVYGRTDRMEVLVLYY